MDSNTISTRSTGICPKKPLKNDLSTRKSPPVLTAEQRAAAAELKRQRAASLRSSFPADDERNWSDIASRLGYRLPPYGVPVTTGGIRRMLGKLGISVDQFGTWFGSLSVNERRETLATIARHYTAHGYPMKYVAGLLLEQIDGGHIQAERG